MPGRTDDTKKMKMSRKKIPMMSSKSKSSKGATSPSSGEDCTGLEEGSSETPYGNRMMQSIPSYDDQFVIQGSNSVFGYVGCTEVAYAVGDGLPYGGIVNCINGGNRATITFRTGHNATQCVAPWFMWGLTDDNVMALYGGVPSSVPERMYFSSVIDLELTTTSGNQIRLDHIRLGETEYGDVGTQTKRYWWFGGDRCSKAGDDSMYCSDRYGNSFLFSRRPFGGNYYTIIFES